MSENYTECLISSVKNCRIIWDMTHKYYHNRLLADKEWTRIAGDLGETIEREMLDLEKKKVDLLYKDDNDDEDMNFFKSLLPHVKLLPSINKLVFRSAVQDLLLNEILKIKNHQQFSQLAAQRDIPCVPSPYASPTGSHAQTSSSDTSQHTSITQQQPENPDFSRI